MNVGFVADACASLDEQQRALESSVGARWFLELAPVRARALARPCQPWLFRSPDGVIAAGFLMQGRAQQGLHVVLVDRLPDTAQFWDGLREFGRAHRVATLSLFSFGDVGRGRPSKPRLKPTAPPAEGADAPPEPRP